MEFLALSVPKIFIVVNAHDIHLNHYGSYLILTKYKCAPLMTHKIVTFINIQNI